MARMPYLDARTALFRAPKACAGSRGLASFMTVSQQVKLTQTEQDLWDQRVDELGLRFEGSPIEPLIARLYSELAQAGVDLRPPCFVSNEWGCPDGQPIIGIPFYLVEPRLHPYEDEHADDVEDAE